MMCSRFLAHHQTRHGMLYLMVESVFDGMVGF